MEKLIKEVIEAAKKNRKGLCRLKNAAVTLQAYELASQLREIETINFPVTPAIKKANIEATDLVQLFKMVEMEIPKDKCWLISEALKCYNKKKGNFSLMDAAKLLAKKEELFFNAD